MMAIAIRSIAFVLAALIALTSTAKAADTYDIATAGDEARVAVSDFAARLEANGSGVQLRNITGIGGPAELVPFLDQGVLDIAVVPFSFIPQLRQSPLLEPFAAEDAAGVRRAINSDVGAYEKAELERKGFRVLDFWHVSSSIFASQSAVRSAQDLEGLKVYQGSQRAGETLVALGAAPVQIPFAEVFASLQAGSIDSSAVPFDNRSTGFGFQNVVTNYVDRVYVPRLYAVVVTDERWSELPFSDQHHIADAAEEIGEALVGNVQAQADQFRETERARGAVFNSWNADDVDTIKLASLSLYPADAIVERALIERAYDTAGPQRQAPAEVTDPRPAANVELLFATDRQVGVSQNPEIAFSSQSKLRGHSFGRAAVSLAEGRTYGNNLKKVSEIESLSDMTETDFFRIIQEADTRDIVLFLHGYNNSFADSIRRGATIQEDIAKDAIVVSYTWPSDGEVLSYGYDTASIDIAEQNLKLFMDTLTNAADPARIHIIAHSMGTRLLARYLAELPERGIEPTETRFKNVVFAAADLTTRFFKQKEEEPFNPDFPLSKYAERITVYSSQYDRPLGLSHKIHGRSLLGLADETELYLDADIVAIDASPIDPARWYQAFSFATRHSYVFDKSAGVRDLAGILNGLKPDARPGMTRKTRDGLPYWVLSP